MHDHVLDRQLPPRTQLFAGLADNAQRNRLASPSKFDQDAGKKRRDDIPTLRRKLRDRLKHIRLDPRDLELDVQECAAGVSSENIFEKRQSPQTFAGSPGNCDSRKPSSVTDHLAVIRGEPHVEFEPVTAVLKGQVEGRDGIFSNRKRARTQTTVSKKKGGLHRA